RMVLGSRQRGEQCAGAGVVIVGEDALDRHVVEKQATAPAAFVDDHVADLACGKRELAARARPRVRLLRERAARGAHLVAVATRLEAVVTCGARNDHGSILTRAGSG